MSPRKRHMDSATDRGRGQALVEFAMTVVLFLVLVMGILDFSRGIFMWNGVSEAAREIARVTSVHPGSPLGTSTETQQIVASQRSVFFNLDNPTFRCVAIDGSTISGTCQPGSWVKVTITGTYTPVSPPLIFLIGHIQLSSTSSIQIP